VRAPCPFRPGDRVRLKPGAAATFRTLRDAMLRWEGRVGTIVNKGLATGNGGRLYVQWDGNRSYTVWEVSNLELVPDDWGVEPATTG
jgi:hypothetical protein